MSFAKRVWRWLAAGVACTLVPVPAAAGPWFDHAALEAGTNSKIRMLRVAVQSDWQSPLSASPGLQLSGHWDLSLAQWHGTAYRNLPNRQQNITGIGFSPILRLRRPDGFGWYAEAGIGVNLLSERYDNDGNALSTHFQFGDQLGLGYVFANKWEAGMKLQHFSNGGLKKPNSGVNFLFIRVSRSL